MAAKTKQKQEQAQEQQEVDENAAAVLREIKEREAKDAEARAWSAPKRGGAKVSQARFVESIFISGLGEYLKTIRSGDSDARHRRRYAMELVGPLLWVRVKHADKETTTVVPVTNLIDLLVED